MTRNKLEPCYSCPNGRRVWHDIGEYESVVCVCPNVCKGCDDCKTPGAILVVRVEGEQ